MGSLLGVIGFFLASWSSELWMMYLTYGLLSGVGHAMISNACTLVILQYFVKWRSVAVGTVASAPAVGIFVMTQITELLLTTFGWQGALRGFAILFCVCGFCAELCLYRLVREMKKTKTSRSTKQGRRKQQALYPCLETHHS